MRFTGTFVMCLLAALFWVGPGTNARIDVADANQILAQATGTVLSRQYFPFLVDEPTYTPTVTLTPTLTPIPTTTPTPYPPITATFVAALTGTANSAPTQTSPTMTPSPVSTFGTTFTGTPNATQTQIAAFNATHQAQIAATIAVYLTQTAVSAGPTPS